MRKAWFVYQMGARHPSPAIIYDHLPDDAAGKSSLKPTILQTHELLDSIARDEHGEIALSFNQLKQAFPYTGDLYKVEVKQNLDSTNKMISEVYTKTLEALGPAELR